MTRYAATIRHHSIAQARVIDAGDTLTAAKRKASAEFNGEQQDYEIVVIDRRAHPPHSNIVLRRRVSERRWWA